MSAYSCIPGRGSEPGIGWNIAREMARDHDVWVLTQGNYKQAIEAELACRPVPGLHLRCYDLPFWFGRWDPETTKAMDVHYYLWQIGIYFTARRLHRRIDFDIAHHVTFGRYWMPSMLALLALPFVWGPVGGGESAPRFLYGARGWWARLFEAVRDVARWLGEHDPLVRITARRSTVALATTSQTAARLRRLHTPQVKILSACGLSDAEIQALGDQGVTSAMPFRFISVGRLLHWKGFHFGLEAFARAGLAHAEYWIVGEGPEAARLQALAEAHGIADRVTFWNFLPREETLHKIAQCHVLVHPSLHDSSGWVCLEAMAARQPVLCLDLGGPAHLVTSETGFKIPVHSIRQVVGDLAQKMCLLAQHRDVHRCMGYAGRRRVQEQFDWAAKSEQLQQIYEAAVVSRATPVAVHDASLEVA